MQDLSVSVYVFQVRIFSVCSRVRAAMTADTGAGVGIVTIDPGFVGTTNVVADSKAYTAVGAAREIFRVFRIQGLSALKLSTS